MGISEANSCIFIFWTPKGMQSINILDCENFECIEIDSDELKSGSGDTYLKSLNLLDCCNICAIAWNHVSQDNIRNCWKSLIPSEEHTISTHQIQSVNAEDLYHSLKISSTYEGLTLEHISEWLYIDADENGWKLRLAKDPALAENTTGDFSQYFLVVCNIIISVKWGGIPCTRDALNFWA
ncbi:hypothetical protein PV327_010067 [Microctonus hyperodae]|uniref:Uncharacterized protein n=1 Tax=Microctonus hyperodae TaxID=165561 RepID=A0AA39F297_MICHY|nr:hypothetical protein PV327_010067 [Microctonus hyperodae]